MLFVSFLIGLILVRYFNVLFSGTAIPHRLFYVESFTAQRTQGLTGTIPTEVGLLIELGMNNWLGGGVGPPTHD